MRKVELRVRPKSIMELLSFRSAALAFETKAIQRKRKIDGGANLLRLALARGPGGFSLRQPSLADAPTCETLIHGNSVRDRVEPRDQ
jgi:hypothetical protein